MICCPDHPITQYNQSSFQTMALIQIIPFWRPTDPHGYLGQWWRSPFTISKKIVEIFPRCIRDLELIKLHPQIIDRMIGQGEFSTSEKFMMMGKAALFGDRGTFTAMSQTDDPRELKALGQGVKNFDQKMWETVRVDIVTVGNYLKFSQNVVIARQLKATRSAVLVEASPFDAVWGIGVRLGHPAVLNQALWRGQNLLGKCLMVVRDVI
jgi:ribA/ribD-fused uncharacterized protein